MKNKKLIMYSTIILIISILLILGYFIILNNKREKVIEYTPKEEITQEQLRQTIVTLYFMNIDSGELMAEARQIDAKKLIDNPYYLLLTLLLEGPKNERLVKLIPEGATLNSVYIEDNTVVIDFSNGFINGQNLGEGQEKLILDSIIKTLAQLNEVNSMIIKIDGEEGLSFPDSKVNFKEKITLK